MKIKRSFSIGIAFVMLHPPVLAAPQFSAEELVVSVVQSAEGITGYTLICDSTSVDTENDGSGSVSITSSEECEYSRGQYLRRTHLSPGPTKTESIDLTIQKIGIPPTDWFLLKETLRNHSLSAPVPVTLDSVSYLRVEATFPGMQKGQASQILYFEVIDGQPRLGRIERISAMGEIYFECDFGGYQYLGNIWFPTECIATHYSQVNTLRVSLNFRNISLN